MDFAAFRCYGRRNADGTKPICAQTRHCTFAGYIDENAVHEKFQRVPPLPDGSVCRFAAIVDELCPSGLAALFMYQHPAVHIQCSPGPQLEGCSSQLKGPSLQLAAHKSQLTGPSSQLIALSSQAPVAQLACPGPTATAQLASRSSLRLTRPSYRPKLK